MEGYSFETDTFSELNGETPLGAYEEGSFEAPSMDGFGELSGEAFGELEGDIATEGEGYDGFDSRVKAKAIPSSAASGAA